MVGLSYGSHPERLCDLLGSLDPSDRARVRILTKDEDADLAAVSLDRFKYNTWGTGSVDWEGVPLLARRFVETDVEAAQLVAELVSSHASDEAEVVVFWANLLIPTVVLPAKAVAGHADEVLAVAWDVWLFVPESSVFVEYWHEGLVTAANVPERGDGSGG